jgi:hypothetical protein
MLGESTRPHRLGKGALDNGGVKVVTPFGTGSILVSPGSGKHPLPHQCLGRLGVFATECAGQKDRAIASFDIRSMHLPRTFDLESKRLAESIGQNCLAVPATLGPMNDYPAPSEIDVLDPQPECFEQAETAAIKHLRYQSRSADHPPKYQRHLRRRENSGPGVQPAASHELRQGAKILLQYPPIQKQERAQSLVLGRGANPTACRQVTKKGHNIIATELGWMTTTMKTNKPPDPPGVRLLGPPTEMTQPNHAPEINEQLWRGGNHVPR